MSIARWEKRSLEQHTGCSGKLPSKIDATLPCTKLVLSGIPGIIGALLLQVFPEAILQAKQHHKWPQKGGGMMMDDDREEFACMN